MKRKLLYLLVGLLAFGVTLLLRAPAEQLVTRAAKPLAQQQVHLIGVGGTLLHGHAAQLGLRGSDLGRLEWRLHPLSLLLGEVAVSFTLEGPDGRLSGELSVAADQSLRLGPLQGRLPAAALLALAELPLPVVVEGYAAVRLDTLQLDPHGLPQRAEGVIGWQEAALRSPQAMALGELQLRLETRDDGIHGTLVEGGGPLRLEGTLTLTPPGAWTLDAGLAARPEAVPALGNYLRMLGNPDAEGLYRLRQNGQL